MQWQSYGDAERRTKLNHLKHYKPVCQIGKRAYFSRKRITMTKKSIYKFWVTATDKRKPRPLQARGRVVKLVFNCIEYEEAVVVRRNLKAIEHFSYVNVRTTKPNLNHDLNFVKIKCEEDSPEFYKES